MTYCGNLFHSSIILFEKNVFRAVVLHLGLNSESVSIQGRYTCIGI